MTSNDKILLVRDWLGDGSWSLPGGGLHRGEVANIGALRELKEETGLQVDPLQLILLDKMVLRGQGFRILVSCFCLNLSDDLFVQPSGREILDVGWFSVDKTLTKLNISSSTRQLIEKWRKQL
ncbi:MAG TPA: NUDIX domain-containing protein [Candidatus Saccharimonadales bacterium]|nr:NUDIX domain-containing protein [Candidatus Saccharimonadales bacterium]